MSVVDPENTLPQVRMHRVLGFVGMSVGGGIGWSLGSHVGVMTAFMLSVVGTGAGLYAARRLADALIP